MIRVVLTTTAVAIAFGAPLVARAQTYTVVAAPDVDASRISEVARALEATGRTAVVVDTAEGPALDPDTAGAVTAVADAVAEVTGAFAELDYARVIARLEQVESAHLAALLAAPEGVAALVELNVWLGASLVGVGRAAEAAERYAQALALDAAYQMDPGFWAEEYTGAFETARARHAPASGSLTIETSPDGASVDIDGAARGTATPATVDASAGWHYVLIRRPGHRPWAGRLNVAAGEVKRIPVALARDEALVAAALGEAMARYATDPPGAVGAVVALTGRDDTIVITASGLVLHDRAGAERGRATGGDARAQVAALFPGVSRPEAGGDDTPWYRTTWFYAGSAAAIVVAGSLAVWAVTRDNDLRGVFVRP